MEMPKCKTCGEEIAKSAKICPKCGAKNKKPIYKKWWFYVITTIAAIIIIASVSGGNKNNYHTDIPNTTTPVAVDNNSNVNPLENIEYISYDVTELFYILDDNAMRAQKLEGSYVEITGYLNVIDSDGKYIGVGAKDNDYDYIFQSIHCKFTDDVQREKVMEMSSGDQITLRGEITDVGEVMGYTLKIHSID